MNGSSVCSIDASNDEEMNSADRKSSRTSKFVSKRQHLVGKARMLDARRPLGVPVEPEV